MACKVDSNLVKQWIMNTGGDAEKKMHVERMRYAVQKDELVLNVSHKMFRHHENVAYPLVISNLSEMSEDTKKLLWTLYASKTYDDFIACTNLLRDLSNSGDNALAPELRLLVQQRTRSDVERADYGMVGYFPFFKAQGYAQGTGYASHVSGDTVCTIMIGGMHTVMNGAFTMHTGDLVQWYFTGEESLYALETTNQEIAGERTERDANQRHKRHKAQQYHDRYAYGMQPITEQHKSNSVFRIKPYRMSKDPENDNRYTDFFGDKCRVFAQCIGGAKPYEMVDIKLMTQSL